MIYHPVLTNISYVGASAKKKLMIQLACHRFRFYYTLSYHMQEVTCLMIQITREIFRNVIKELKPTLNKQ